LKEIESRANNFPTEALPSETPAAPKNSAPASKSQKSAERVPPAEVDDGRRTMHKIFVESKIISPGDFDLCWTSQDLSEAPSGVSDPFIQVLADKGILPVEKSLRIMSDKIRSGYLPLDTYDIDLELARTFPAEACQRWCVLPFDRMSKSVFVATANPFNQQAAKELSEATPNRLLWYLVPPVELIKCVRKAFR
jgi:hypothetical protein